MLRENLKDTGQILQNILTQPLAIPGIDAPISLLEAARLFSAADPASSQLKKMIETFIEYKESTQALLQEISLLASDLQG